MTWQTGVSRTGERYPVNGRIRQSREKKKKKAKMLATFGKTPTVGILRVQGKKQNHPCYHQAMLYHAPWDKERHNIGLLEKPSNIKLCMGDGEG